MFGRSHLAAVGALLGTLFGAVELRSQADFRADANLVVLHVSVTDRRHELVDRLPESAFHVFEDGIPQKTSFFLHEDLPVAVGLVVDNSGSMGRKLPDVVAGAEAFARSSNPQDQMFVVHFNERATLGLPHGEAFVSSPDKLKSAMLQIQAKGKTALYDAIAMALEHISGSSLQKKVLIVLSDGGDNASKAQFGQILDRIRRSDVTVYTVGLFDQYDEESNPKVLRQLSGVSGGEAFFPKQIPDVTAVLQAIARDIRTQYTIGYTPANVKADGSYHFIRVKVSGPRSDKWVVRTRSGYFAPKS